MPDFGPVDAKPMLVLAEVPKLESEPAVLADRIARLGIWQTWIRAPFDDSPSWLVSLVIHLVCFLLIASISVPWKRAKGGSDRGTVELTMGFADRTESTRGEELTLEPEPVPTPQDAAEPTPQQPGTEGQAQDNSTRPSTQQAKQSAQPKTRERQEPIWQPPTISRQGDDDPLRPSPYAAILQRHRAPPVSEPTTVVAVNTIQRMSPEPTVPEDPKQQSYDRIVDNFIAYDVGRLRGRAGKAAMAKFSQLGTDAVPALVRGLNKAASIHASCPVGVLAGKLVLTLQKAGDPSLRQYAIDNVGRDVPSTAPHFKGLSALRKRWLSGPRVPERVATYVQRMETRAEGELMELMLALSDSDVEIVAAALRSGDDYLAGAATLSLIQGGRKWNVEQRAKLRPAVNHFQASTDNQQLQGLARDALSSVAR